MANLQYRPTPDLDVNETGSRPYDADWIGALAVKKSAWANIPPRYNRNEPICFSPYLYRARNLVERFFNKIKHHRRVATRYDKLAVNYLAFVQLASIRRWLRVNNEVDAPPTASMCQSGGVKHHSREASVSEVSIIGLDIAKHVFHAHGVDGRGLALFSKRISRGKVLDFFAAQRSCTVALEACGGAHHWARQLTQLGHEVRLIPPAYVKPFVKRQKNDAIDAEAICEAAQRPSMRFVAVKSEEQQAAGLVFRTRDLLVRQRTQLINAVRGHLTEYGWVAPKGPSHMARLADLIEEEEMVSSLPEAAHAMFRLMLDLLASLNDRIAHLDKEIARRAREDEVSRRLMTIPGIGPISATAIAALAPPVETFAKSRDFAAWLGLTPLQRSTGGKQKLGGTSKMGERTLRRLLIIGSSAVVQQASKRGAPRGSWLEQMLTRKPRMVVTVALANKMARIVWALLVKQENYRAPVAAKA